MKNIPKKILHNWYWVLAGAVIVGEAAVFLYFGEESYIAVHDNLDLFMGHFRVLKLWNLFFSQDATAPMLGGISRDLLASEFSLYNILYWLIPSSYYAYLCGYFLKILISIASVCLLVWDICAGTGTSRGSVTKGQQQEEAGKDEPEGKETVTGWHRYRPAAVMCGLLYGVLPLFPAYGIAFASIPLVIFLLRRVYRGAGKQYYLFVFLYPLLSYFSYFGIFILAYLAAAILILWVRDACRMKKQAAISGNRSPAFRKSFSWHLLIALFVLAAGYMVFEYRLFREMLFSDTVSIRSTMAEDNLTASQILKTIWEVFSQAIFHAQPSHTYFILPLCALFLLYLILSTISGHRGLKAAGLPSWKAKVGGLLTHPFILTLGLILFNCVIYGFYYWEGFRELFETLVPPLEGFQFNRTVFFNPFLWVAALFFIVKELYDQGGKWLPRMGNLALVIALLVALMTPQVYNDFYYTCYYHAYRIVKGTEVEALNYREFYSQELFAGIKEELDYDGEYAIAYGMHPAVLSYNGIATLDGYLGLYSQEYKEAFGAMIEPATERVEEWEVYFWDWGARAYIFSGSGENTWNAVRTMQLSDQNLYIDGDQFRALGGTYVFSRIELTNAEELGLELKGVYEADSSPYTIYVYTNSQGI